MSKPKTCHFCGIADSSKVLIHQKRDKKHSIYICEECVGVCAMIILANKYKKDEKERTA